MSPSRYGKGRWFAIEGQGLVAADRIVAAGLAQAAAMKRLVGSWPPEMVLDLTGRQKRETVLVLDSGHLLILPVTIEAVVGLLLDMEESCE